MRGTDKDVGARLARLDTCAVSDALDRLAMDGAVGGFLRWGPRRRVVGRAVTVTLELGPTEPGASHLGTRALAEAGSDDVIVVANAGRTHAGAWGGLLTLEAHLRGVAGVVVDGAVRDADDVDALDVALFARAATPRTARGRFREVATGAPVVVAGTRVEAGDWVLADGSGVVFVRRGQVLQVLALAEEIAAEEAKMAVALREGRGGPDVLNGRYEGMTLEGHP